MSDYVGYAMQGLFTGIGVILAHRIMGWLDSHPLFKRVSNKVGDVLSFDIERESGTKKKRSR